jgi:hypothetical protein
MRSASHSGRLHRDCVGPKASLEKHLPLPGTENWSSCLELTTLLTGRTPPFTRKKIYIYLGKILRRPRFDPRSDHVEFMVDQLALGHAFSEYFISPTNFHSTKTLYTHLSYRADIIVQILGDVPSGLSLILPHEIKK